MSPASFALGLVISMTTAMPALAATEQAPVPSAKMCIRAVVENRMGDSSVSDCMCIASAFRSAFAPKLYALWSVAVFTGHNLTQEIRGTGLSQAAVTEQFDAGAKAVREQCEFMLGG